MTDYERRYLEERAAVRAYTEAFRALQINDLRRGPDDLIVDDPAEDDRLAHNFAHAARRWKQALNAIGCPLPPGLENEATGRVDASLG